MSKNTPTADWGTLHTPKLKHALSVAFPDHADQLDKDCAKINGDNDCVFMAGYSMKFGFQATSSALSRYVFDVGAWDNCRWIVFHGASGHPASPYLREPERDLGEGRNGADALRLGRDQALGEFTPDAR